MIAPEILAAKQALLKARMEQRTRTGRKRKELSSVTPDTAERALHRLFVLNLLQRGWSYARCAIEAERKLGRKITPQMIERWHQAGCPFA